MSTHNVSEIRKVVEKQRDQIWTDLSELVSFNSVHNEPGLEAPYQGAVEWVEKALTSVGLDVQSFATIDGSTTFLATKQGKADAPTVLLYSHYDVVPAGDPNDWTNDPFTLTERDGRWYARGAADCKGNLVMHLAALRTIEELGGSDLNIKVLIEGSEERGGEGLDSLIKAHPEYFKADVILIADSGNVAVGEPTLTTSLRGGGQLLVRVDTLKFPVHSGGFGGPAPDAVAALVRLLDTLRDENGCTTIDGVDCSQNWEGAPYDPEVFRADAGVLDGVSLMGGDGDDVASQVWSRPAISITGFDSTPIGQAVNAVPATASAKLNLRVPPGLSGEEVANKLRDHLINRAPWGAKVSVDILEVNDPFVTNIEGPAMKELSKALKHAYEGKELSVVGTGGSIPLCTELQKQFPEAEIALFGVEEPLSTIHSPDESVSPDEIRNIAITEAFFLLNYGK